MLVLKFTGLVFFAVATMCTGVPNTWFHRDYCNRTRECAEGTHVMCMYYDPFKAMGPACSENATEVAVINRYKSLLLNIFNEIRKLAANGEETGKNEKLLPRAYGLKRLKWDDELAAFAQVFANQCSLTRDLCRATSKFYSPGQFTGVNVFKFPDWEISELNKEGFHHEDKVIAALKNILKRAYFLKKLVTKQLIQNYPNILSTRTTDLFDRETILKQLYKIRPYLNIIHGGTSHVGCGISAYVKRGNFKDQADDDSFNIIELTCNFSGEPSPELPVYETIRPKRLGWSTTCGCPPGFSEDEDCLCVEYGTRNKDEADSGRAARVISLLESFATREEKLYNQPTEPGNARRVNPTYDVSQPINDLANNLLGVPHDPSLEAKLSSLKEKILNKQLRKFIDHEITPEFIDIKLNEVPTQIYRLSRSPKPQLKKSSIFSRANKFVLPIQHENTDLPTYRTEPLPNIRNTVGNNNEFHQVRPRKDYSKMTELVTDYVNKKRSRKSIPAVNYLSQNRKLKSVQHAVVEQTTTPETMIIKKAVRSIIKEPDYSTKRESNNLLNLLDKLEQEVKYIELNEHVKEIIDKKMRKIYDSVIHDPKRLLTPEQSDVVDGLVKILNNNRDDPVGFNTDMPTTDVQLTRLLSKNLDEMREDRVKFVENSPDSYGKVDDQMSDDVDSPTTDVHLPSLLDDRFLENSADSDRKGDDQIAFDPDTPTTEGQLTSLIKKNQDEMRQDSAKFIANFAVGTGKGDIYDSFYRDDKISLDDKLDAYYKRQQGNKPSGATDREMIRDLAIRDADEVLGSIRRKFYQDKLNNLRRKLERMRGYTRPNDDEQNNSDNHPKEPFTTSLEYRNRWSSSTSQNYNLNRPALLTAFETE